MFIFYAICSLAFFVPLVALLLWAFTFILYSVTFSWAFVLIIASILSLITGVIISAND